MNKARAYKLEDGVVFTLLLDSSKVTIQFEQGVFYEVNEEPVFDGFVGLNPKYAKTGRVFTIEELNRLFDKDKI